MISIITIVNKKDIFYRGLKQSLSEQKACAYELVEVENIHNEYNSLSKAYNNALGRCNGEWIMFAHPDIYFHDEYELSKMIANIEKISKINSNIKIFGVAGVANDNGKLNKISSIVHGEDKRGGYINSFDGEQYKKVQTVDACCYVIKKKDIVKYKFWDGLKGFHMCVEELCLRLENLGNDVVVIPVRMWHFSDGKSLDYTYYRETIRVIKKYPNLDILSTTSFQWKINKFIFIRLRYYELRNYMHHKILKLWNKVTCYD